MELLESFYSLLPDAEDRESFALEFLEQFVVREVVDLVVLLGQLGLPLALQLLLYFLGLRLHW